jgi:hypothetical protein
MLKSCRKHTNPQDITYEQGRTIQSKKDIVPDYATMGCLKIQNGKMLQKWAELRCFERATTEIWDERAKTEIWDDESDDE